MWEKVKENSMVTLLLSIGAVYFFLRYISPLVAPGILALIFVTAFGPFLKRIKEKFHICRQVGVLLLLLVFIALFFSLLTLLISWILGSIPDMVAGGEDLYGSLEQGLREMSLRLNKLLHMDSRALEESLLLQTKVVVDNLSGVLTTGVMNGSVKWVGKAGGGLLFVGIFLIGAYMLAKDYDNIMNRVLEREEFYFPLSVFCEVIRYLATLIKAQLVIMPITGALCGLVLSLLRIKNGIFWGILAGILDAMPMIGTGVVLVPVAIISLIGGKIVTAVVVIVLYVGCMFLRQSLEPRLIGKQMGIPPIALLLSLYGGIQLFGAIGIIKGPLGYLVVKTVMEKRVNHTFTNCS